MIKLVPVFILVFCSCSLKNTSETPHVPSGPLSTLYNPTLYPFYHGVASGDPLQDAVIIWTKITPIEGLRDHSVLWEISEDENFKSLIQNGVKTAQEDDNFTIKVDVSSLSPDTRYFYRFKNDGRYSPVGHTRTLPNENVSQIKFAIVSCSNWEWGYFNAYKHLANKDLNAVLHLGDYIYEYGIGTYGDTTIGRTHVPAHEITTLDDYRLRYAQYRLDEDLQLAHRMHPFINIWDDHEIANDAYSTGAQNHQTEEGSYEQRKSAAKKAFYEWMPVRENNNLYRSFRFGNLASVMMLDERLAGRTKPPKNTSQTDVLPYSHTMLGVDQLDWFLDELNDDNETWHIVGNQVIFSYLNYGRPDITLNTDSWDGYPRERQKIIDHIVAENINNVVFVTGDTHSSLALDVVTDPFNGYDISGKGAIAVELGTTSINSGNADERFPADSVELYEKGAMKKLNPHLKYVNMRDHGYLLVTLSPKEAKAEWYFVDNLKTRESQETLAKTLYVNVNEPRLQER